jgi:cell division protease FtsH
MEFRRFFPGTALLIAVAALLFFVLDYANPGSSHQQVGPSEIISLINHGQVESALITDENQTIQVTTKSGKQLEASWVSGQEFQFENALKAQFDRGNLPGGYNVNVSKSNALRDVLLIASILLAIILLFFWRIGYPTRIKRWRAFADQAG